MNNNDLENYRNAKEYVNRIRKSPIFNNPLTYQSKSVDSAKLYSELMKLYFSINPDWKDDFENAERRNFLNYDSRRTVFSGNESLQYDGKSEKEKEKMIQKKQELIISDPLEESLQVALSINVSNQIAHECDRISNQIIKYYFLDEKKAKLPDSKIITYDKNGEPIYDKDVIYDLGNAIRLYLKRIKRGAPIRKEKEEFLIDYGISESILNDFVAQNGKDILDLINMHDLAMYIKDINIARACIPQKEGEDPLLDQAQYSYGIITPDTNPRLIIDVPYYSQFCVHVIENSSRGVLLPSIKNYPYGEIHFFEKQSFVLIPDCNSPDVQDLIGKKGLSQNEIWNNIRLLASSPKYTDRRNSHRAVIASGASKEDFDQLYR